MQIGQSETVNAYPQNFCEKFTSHSVEKANQLIIISDITFLMSQTIRNEDKHLYSQFTDRWSGKIGLHSEFGEEPSRM